VWSRDFPCGGEFHIKAGLPAASSAEERAEKLRAAETEGHEVINRCVQEEWSRVDVLCVGEAPGRNEDKQAVPFVGQSGKLLRETIAELSHLKPGQFGFSNVVRCRPPRNKTPGKTITKACLPQLVREIEARKPKVLMALGAHALEWLTGNTGILALNAQVLDCVLSGLEHLKVAACVHPAYVARADHEMVKLVEGFETVQSYINGDYEPLLGPGEYHVLTKLRDVKTLIRRYRRAGRKVAVDTETGSLYWFQDKWPRLLCFSLTNKPGEAYVIPLDHKDSPWRIGGRLEHQRGALLECIGELLEDPEVEKILQNGKFDDKHITAAIGYTIVNYRDTMLTHLVLDERRGTHDLGTLAHRYTGMGGYEKPLEHYRDTHPDANPKRGGSYANIPGDVLFLYAAMDADVTYRVDDALLDDEDYADNPRLQALAETFLPALSVVLSDMEYNGAQIDPEVVEVLERKYTKEMRRQAEKVATFPEVMDYAKDPNKTGEPGVFNPGSHEQLQDVLFGRICATPTQLTDGGFDKLSLRHKNCVAKWMKVRRGKKPRFQAIVKEAIKNEEWRMFSTDAEVLHDLARGGNLLVNHILDYREAETLYGTFVKPLLFNLDPEGRIHCDYLIHGTVTGRLSSTNPNLQNIPNKGGGLIKSAYISRFGDEGVIGQADYSQAELRVAACWFNEPTMLKAYREGKDVHKLTALDVSNLTLAQYERLPADEQKRWRVQAKRINFGCLYGGGPPALQSALRKEGDYVTLDECEALIERYFEVRPKLKAGIEKLEEEVRRLGYLEGFAGHRRRIPEVFSEDEKVVARAVRQLVNFPIQNAVGVMTLIALVIIWSRMRDAGYRSKIILTVHDSIIFDLHVDEAYEILAMAKEVMENIRTFSDEVLPGLDWSWLKVEMKVDCELGGNWQGLVGFNPDTIAEGEETEKELWGWNDDAEEWYLARDPVNEDELWEAMEWKLEKSA
jgi:uracil-DNA glycosylase family 4